MRTNLTARSVLLQANPSHVQSAGLRDSEHHECQNAFSIFPSHPGQDCSSWQWVKSNAGFTAQLLWAPQHPLLAQYGAHIRKKTQSHSQELPISKFIFIFLWEGRSTGRQKQKQPLLPPTTEQNCNNQEDEGYLIHVVQLGKPTYPFPSPSCTKQTLIVFGFFQAFQVQFLGVLSKLQLDIYFKFKLNFIWISALDLFIYHFNIWFLETLILICKALPMHSELYQRKKTKPKENLTQF